MFTNLQLSVEKIHIRYEDQFSNPGNPFTIGVTISKFIVTTTDSEWRRGSTKSSKDDVYKVISLESISIYWDSCSTSNLFENLSEIEFKSSLEGLISIEEKPKSQCAYVLRPTSINCFICLNTNPNETPGIPKVNAKIELKKGLVEVRAEQHHNLLYAMCLYTDLIRRKKYLKYGRPQIRPIESNGARSWWKYAQTCIISEIKEKNRKWSWSYFEGDFFFFFFFFFFSKYIYIYN